MKKFNQLTEAQMSQAKGGDFGFTVLTAILLAGCLGATGAGYATQNAK